MPIKQAMPKQTTTIKQVKVETAQFGLRNEVLRDTLQRIASLPNAERVGVFGDVIQGHQDVATAGVVLFAYDCKTFAAFEAMFKVDNILFMVQRECDKNPTVVQLYAVLEGGQIFEYESNSGWGVAKVSQIIRERIAINSVSITDFMQVSMSSESASVPKPIKQIVAGLETPEAKDAPDWAHVLMNKLSKIPESAILSIFGSVITLHKEPADLDVAVVCETDDWNDAQTECADLLADLLNLKENGWLGELLDLYVCLTDASYVYSDEVGDWIPVFDGKQLAEDVRSKGKPLSTLQTAAITNKVPKRRRLKTDPEHRKDRLEYKKEMKNPTARRLQRKQRKIYVKKNKPKLQRKADTYRTWRARQNF